jgi:hypothetical protein
MKMEAEIFSGTSPTNYQQGVLTLSNEVVKTTNHAKEIKLFLGTTRVPGSSGRAF